MLRILLLEDEEYNREFFKKLIYELPIEVEVFDTSSGEAAIGLAREHTPDLCLLDVELENDSLNGLDVAKSIFSFNQQTYFVFVTGYEKYAVDSFDVHPYSYILKPIKIDKFKDTIIDIDKKIEQVNVMNGDALLIKFKNERVYLNESEIICIEKQNKIAIINTCKGIYNTSMPLKELEPQLDPAVFIRVHNSFIVNLNYIKKIKPFHDRSYEIELYGLNKTVLMSRYKFQKYKKRLNLSTKKF